MSLIVAALDLQLVRSIRRAIAHNKVELLPARCDRLARLRTRFRPEPKIEPRFRIKPEPRIEPRKVIQPTPRIEPRFVDRTLEPHQPVRATSPILPPWRAPLSELPAQPLLKVKLNIIRPDVIHKGTLIDFFI